MTENEWDVLGEQFAAFHARFAPYFFRREVRERSGRYLRALLGPVERKNGWQLAEAMGEGDPNGAQRLLYQAIWDEEAVKDELEALVAELFGEPNGIFVLDETSFLKKGVKSVGVKRQYAGTVGKIENCQVGVFLSYVSSKGHTFLDRRLYLPREWADDPARRAEAGVPEAVGFQTKPELGQAMLEHAYRLGVPGRWVTSDEEYGSDGALRRWLEDQKRSYVLAVRSNERVWITTVGGPCRVAVAEIAAQLPAEVWVRLSAGEGAKGPRLYDWALVCLPYWAQPDWGRWLLLRRSLSEPAELGYYLVFAPTETALAEMVRVAGARWTIEQCLEEAKGESGLDHYEVRSWRSWHRHITLSLLAHLLLACMRQRAATAEATLAAGEKSALVEGVGVADSARSAAAAGDHAAAVSQLATVSPGLVAVASTSSRPGPDQPLSPAWRPTVPFTASQSYVRL